MESVDFNSDEANNFQLLFDNENFYNRSSAKTFIFNIFGKNKSLCTYKKEGKYSIGSNLIHIQCTFDKCAFRLYCFKSKQ